MVASVTGRVASVHLNETTALDKRGNQNPLARRSPFGFNHASWSKYNFILFMYYHLRGLSIKNHFKNIVSEVTLMWKLVFLGSFASWEKAEHWGLVGRRAGRVRNCARFSQVSGGGLNGISQRGRRGCQWLWVAGLAVAVIRAPGSGSSRWGLWLIFPFPPFMGAPWVTSPV